MITNGTLMQSDDKLYRKLYLVAFRMLRDRETAEDMVQETYTKLFEKGIYSSNVDDLESYAVTTLRNTCMNQLKRQKFTAGMPVTERQSPSADYSERFDSIQAAEYVRQLIADLPLQQSMVMTLRHIKGLSYKEISSITGLDEGNIRVLISRGRKTIREQFEKNNSYEG